MDNDNMGTPCRDPAYVQFTVLRARNLIVKGKGGNNDVFATIQLGKEKYQTSTIKNAHNPEWFEECDLPIPHMHSEIEVQLFHRGLLSDNFLGYAAIPLWEQKIHDAPKAQWIKLKTRPNKISDNKNRGEVEIKVIFHSQSRVDSGPGLKKRSSSIRDLATAVGDKLRLARSKSFRENRKDSESKKTNKQNQNRGGSLQNLPEAKVYVQRTASIPPQGRTSAVLPAVSFPALDLDRSWADQGEEGLTRSYSMSAAYVKSMSLDRGQVLTLANSANQTAEDVRSQSLYNIAGNRRSMVELPSSKMPPPYQLGPASQDDMTLIRQEQGFRPYLRPTLVANPSYFDPVLRREHARYESIRERTEPEESSSSDGSEVLRRRPRPPRRSSRSKLLKEDLMSEQRDSGMASLPSQCGGSSREATPVYLEGGEGQVVECQRSETITNGSLVYDRFGLVSTIGNRPKSASSSPVYMNGDVRLRKRSKRERSQLLNQAGRRFTVHGLEGRTGGLYDDSLSDPSDSSRVEVNDDLISVYKNLTKEELLRLVIQNKAQLIRKDHYIKDLENYIDNLLVRVMEATPRILNRPPMQHR